tara:strand:- start:1680 stop:2447 length:768 start_codon:yes stop_codon:yes gene_type:complete
MSALTLSNNGQKYVSWKGVSTNSAVPTWSKPDPAASGPAFKARPINHYRKQLMPVSGRSNGNSAIGMPMDTPGGTISLGTTDCNGNQVVLKETITHDPCNECYEKPTRSASTITRSASTIVKKNYYTDSRAYMRSRCRTYDQNTSIGEKKVGSVNAYNATNCYDPSGCSINKSVIYKPNNTGFATQGAVSSGSRLLKLKVETITRNANSFSAYGHAAQNAGRYNGNSTAPYFLKSKENKCTPSRFHRNGKMTMCF